MILEIIIPSKGRIQKLERCLNSIFLSSKNRNIKLRLCFSIQSELDYFKNLLGFLPNIVFEMVEYQKASTFWNYYLANLEADGLCYLNDDVLLFEDTLDVAIEEFQQHFPDGDGILGLRQANLPVDQALEGAFGIIGKKYTERFPNKAVWCPDYYRFYGDREMWRYAKSIGKFYYCIPARIEHLHPCTNRNYIDDTHRDVRTYSQGDKDIFNQRQAAGLLWGQSFTLINKNS